jgi:hypothetical protein
VNIGAFFFDDDDFYLFLQKQQPTHRYITIGYVPPGIKESTLWYYDDPCTPLDDVGLRKALHRSTNLSAFLYK